MNTEKKHLLTVMAFCLPLLLFMAVANAALSDGLVSYWKLDEAAGSTAHDEVRGVNDNAYNATWTTGLMGNAFTLGNVKYYDVDKASEDYDFIQGNNNYTITFLRYFTGGGVQVVLGTSTGVGGDNGIYYNYQTSGNKLSVKVADGDGGLTIDHDSSACITGGNWYQVVYRMNRTHSAFWANGTACGAQAFAPDAGGASTYNMTFGVYPSDHTTYPSTGILDEVGIWNRPLSDSEIITDLWNGGALWTYTAAVNSVTLDTPVTGSNIYWAGRTVNFAYTPIAYTTNYTSCSLFINNTNVASNASTVVNNTLNGISFTLTSGYWGYNEWLIGCGATNSSTNTFTFIRPFGWIEVTSDADALEAELKTYSGTAWYNSTDGWAYNTSIPFYWNDTNIGNAPTVSQAGAATNYTLTAQYPFYEPLIYTNGSDVANNFSFEFYEVANTSNRWEDRVDETETLYYGFYWPDYYPDTLLLWGDTLDLDAAFTEQNHSAVYNVTAWFDDANHTLTYAAGVWGTDIATPEPAGNSESWVSNATFFLNWTGSDGGGARQRSNTSENETITITKASLVACGGALSNTTTLNFTFYDEEDVATITGANMDATFWVYPVVGGVTNSTINVTASFNFTDTFNATICIYPTWATVEVDSWQSYWGNETTNDNPRAYFLDGAQLDNSTEEINLFIINDTWAMLIEVGITDSDSAPITDALVYFAKYYPSENVYRTIAMIRTDDFGEGSTYLRPNDIWYRFSITQNGTTVGTFSPQTVTCNPAEYICQLYLTLSPSTWLEYTQYYDKFSYACAFNASGTNATVCSYTDASGLMQYARLQVWKTGLFSPVQVCDTNLTTASGSLTCNLGIISGLYTYTLSAHFADEITLFTDEIDASISSALFGVTGIIAAAFVFILAALAGAHSAGAVLIMGTVGLIAAQLLGLLGLAPSAIVAFAVVALALFVKMKGGAK